MKKVRWGIIGAGGIAKSFVKDFPLMENAELVGIASSNQQRADEFAAAHKIPQSLSYQAMYTSSDIDAVYIATTHNFHFEQVKQCLLHGKAVLCEKPITVNDTECRDLLALAAEKKLFLMEAMWTYFLPAIQKAKEWVNEKLVGEINLIQSDFGVVMEKDPENRWHNPQLAGGALLDLGIYPLAIARFFSGQRPEKIQASATFTASGVDKTVTISSQYPGFTASLNTSLNTHLCNATRIYGEKGYVEIPLFWRSGSASVHDKEGNLLESFQDGRTAHGFIYEMQHANDLILAGALESPIIPHSITLELQEAMTDIRRQIGLKYPYEP